MKKMFAHEPSKSFKVPWEFSHDQAKVKRSGGSDMLMNEFIRMLVLCWVLDNK